MHTYRLARALTFITVNAYVHITVAADDDDSVLTHKTPSPIVTIPSPSPSLPPQALPPLLPPSLPLPPSSPPSVEDSSPVEYMEANITICDEGHEEQEIFNNPKPIHIEKDSESFCKIYDGSEISICGFNCLVAKFANTHKLTYSAIDDLLDLFKFICPKPNLIPTSLYKFKNFFKQFENNSSNTKFCMKCKNPQDDGCTCEAPETGQIIAMSVETPLQAILCGK